MDRDKMLPLVAHTYPEGQLPDSLWRDGWYSGIQTQKDSDLVILERDYVPKEKVKALVEALESFMRNKELLAPLGKYSLALEALTVSVEDALAQLRVKK